ncbi:MAG: squalene/phytoene synthase family protein [Akkermansiaceae bacterium]
MEAGLQTDVLKAVSRSFYLSLRLLPRQMRRPASLAYLLARTSDTIADSLSGPVKDRVEYLDGFLAKVRGESDSNRFLQPLADGLKDDGERVLLQHGESILTSVAESSDGEILLIREVMEDIVKGQKLDLMRFEHGDEQTPVVIESDEALEEYTWLVAGCVGRFWTKLGFLSLGDRYAEEEEDQLIQLGTDYGKGLQLVNILRDLPEDLKNGRCYLPVGNPADRENLMLTFQKWRREAVQKVSSGSAYSAHLLSRRLRVASVLPARIADLTLERMEGISFFELQNRIKVPRTQVYGLLLKEFCGLNAR